MVSALRQGAIFIAQVSHHRWRRPRGAPRIYLFEGADGPFIQWKRIHFFLWTDPYGPAPLKVRGQPIVTMLLPREPRAERLGIVEIHIDYRTVFRL